PAAARFLMCAVELAYQVAGLGLPRLDALKRALTRRHTDQPRIGEPRRQRQAALLLAGHVAGDAVLLEDRQHLALEADRGSRCGSVQQAADRRGGPGPQPLHAGDPLAGRCRLAWLAAMKPKVIAGPIVPPAPK